MTYRVAYAQLSHETNVFSSTPTDLAAFKAAGLRFGADVVAAERDTNTCIGGFIEAGEEAGFDLVPLLSVWATPSGIVTRDALETLIEKLSLGIEKSGPFDGMLLALHGAMVSEQDRDGDAYVLERIGDVIGPAIPLVVTLDLHANISQRMVDAASVLVGYDTYPHTDMSARGAEAVGILNAILSGAIQPVSALLKPPMMPTSQRMTTDRDPMRSIVQAAHAIEAQPDVINVTVAGGFPPADCDEAGISILVTTNDDLRLARKLAIKLAETIWNERDAFLGGVDSFEFAADVIANHPPVSDPLVIVDIGDNPWTGGPGDSAELLQFLLTTGVRNSALAIIRDPESVQLAVSAGVGDLVDLILGGKTDSLHGGSLPVNGRVRMLSDGKYVNQGPMMAGIAVDLGPTAVVEVAGIGVLITSRAETPIDLNIFRRHGIEPTSCDVIGLKGKGHFRAAFEPIASRVILVEGPGITGADLSRLPLQHVRRPIWPLDINTEWIPETL